MAIYDRQNLYYIKQNALTELGDYAGGLENSRALLNSLDPESEDDNYMRAWAIEQLIRLHRFNRNYTQSLRWVDEAIKIPNLRQRYFSPTAPKCEKGANPCGRG